MGKMKKAKAESSQDPPKNVCIRKKGKGESRFAKQDHLAHIPFRLRELMKSQEMMSLGSSKLRKMRKAMAVRPEEGAAKATDIPVPHFRRGKRESKTAYLQRMNRETRHVLFLTQNQVERQPETESQEQEQPAGRHKAVKNKEFNKVKLEKIRTKKMAKMEHIEEKEKFTDRVNFGEVAMAPPSLTAKPKRAPTKAVGATKGLLLNSLLGQAPVSTTKPSMARQRMMEEERMRVVEAYRHMKKEKQEKHGLKMTGKDKP